MKTIFIVSCFIATFFVENTVSEGATRCYVCIDEMCDSNPGIQNCESWIPSSAVSVCVGSMRKLSTGWSKYKECESLSSDLISRCRDKDNEAKDLKVLAEGCYYCRGNLCNVGW